MQMTSNTGRVPAVDIARGLVITGVVFNHTVDGLVVAEMLELDSYVSRVNQALYIFRMPALAFLLGLFIPTAVMKRGSKGYVRERVTFALYIYLVWFFIQSVAEVLTSGVRNHSRSWESVLHVWTMPAHLWFLPFLAVATAVTVLAAPWKSSRRAWATLGALALLSVAAWGWNPEGWFGARGLSLLIFVAVGAFFGLEQLRPAMSGPWTRPALIGAGAASLFAVLLTLGTVPGTLNSNADLMIRAGSMLAAAAGIVLILCIAALIALLPWISRALGLLGHYTLPIYLAHVIIAAGTRVAFSRIGITDASIILVSAVILGTALPVIMALMAPKIGMAWLFAPPSPLRHWSQAANVPPRHPDPSKEDATAAHKSKA